MTADGVNFINENDAGRILLALFEKVADAAGAHADKHFHEVGPGDRKKRNVRFTGNSARKKSLSRAWGANQQNALGNATAKFLEFLRIFQEFDDFLKLFFGLIGSRNILESGFFLLRGKQTRSGFAKAEGFVPASLHLAH